MESGVVGLGSPVPHRILSLSSDTEAVYEVVKQKSAPLLGEILVGKGYRLLFGDLLHIEDAK